MNLVTGRNDKNDDYGGKTLAVTDIDVSLFRHQRRSYHKTDSRSSTMW